MSFLPRRAIRKPILKPARRRFVVLVHLFRSHELIRFVLQFEFTRNLPKVVVARVQTLPPIRQSSRLAITRSPSPSASTETPLRSQSSQASNGLAGTPISAVAQRRKNALALAQAAETSEPASPPSRRTRGASQALDSARKKSATLLPTSGSTQRASKMRSLSQIDLGEKPKANGTPKASQKKKPASQGSVRKNPVWKGKKGEDDEDDSDEEGETGTPKPNGKGKGSRDLW